MKKMLMSLMTVLLATGVFAAQPDIAPPYQPTDSELASIRAKLDEFYKAYKALPIGRAITTMEAMTSQSRLRITRQTSPGVSTLMALCGERFGCCDIVGRPLDSWRPL